MLEYACRRPLSYRYKLALIKLMHKVFHHRLPQELSDTIAIKNNSGHSLRIKDLLMVALFWHAPRKKTRQEHATGVWQRHFDLVTFLNN